MKESVKGDARVHSLQITADMRSRLGGRQNPGGILLPLFMPAALAALEFVDLLLNQIRMGRHLLEQPQVA